MSVVTSASGWRRRATSLIAWNISVSVELSVAGQFGPCGFTVIAVSLMTRTISARNAWGSCPGSRRTSIAAVAVGGITLVLALPFRPVIEIVLRRTALYVRSLVSVRAAAESRIAERISDSQRRMVVSRSIVARSRNERSTAGVTISGVFQSA